MKRHLGKSIKEAVKTSGLSVTEFAAKINCSRRNIYAIFEKESIDTSLLVKIGEVLGHNFFTHYSVPSSKTAHQSQTAETSGVKEYTDNRIKELTKEVEYLKEINELLKAQLDKKANKKTK